MSAPELKDKVVLITGGGTGIGSGLAECFAAAGAAVWLVGRRPEPLQTVTRTLIERGGQAGFTAGDVTEGAVGERAVKECVQQLGALHVLINNAGRGLFSALATTPDALLAETLDVNLRGPILLAKYAQPELARHKEQGGGVILNIASSVAHRAVRQGAVYAAAKAGLLHLTRCLALELAPLGIRVNCISPGAVVSPGLLADGPVPVEVLARKTPLGRVGAPLDVAAAALFLCSPAASWITGAELAVDGGLSAG